MITDGLTAIAFLAMAYAVNELFASAEDILPEKRRMALMLTVLTGALMETTRIAMAPLGIALFNQALGLAAALCLLAVPACFWPVVMRLRRGRIHIVNRRLLARASRAEAKAAAAQSWLDMAEQAGHVGHWKLTLPDNRLIWSDEVYRIHGLWREHYHPRMESALAAFHPLDGKRIGALMQEVTVKGGNFEATVRLRRPDGEIRHVMVRAQARLDETGAVEALDGVMVDVTEPRRTDVTRPPAHAGAAELDEGQLTGLAERKQFDASLSYEFKRAVRSRKPLGLVLVEIDQFGQYASHNGRRQSDICLRTVAQAVQALPRRTGDVVAHFGKTEIAVLLPLADIAGAERVAAQIAETVRGLGLPDARREGLLTISCGAAAFLGVEDLYNPNELSRRAKHALADAKLFGGDRVCGYRQTEFAGVPAPHG